MKSLFRLSAAAAGLAALGACVVSELALFTAENAAATPLAAGEFEACSGSTSGEAPDCNKMAVTLDADGAYAFLVEDDRVDARMLAIDEDDFAVQLSEGGDNFQYYWGRISGPSLKLVMMWCEDLPAALVDKLVADGAMSLDADRQTCTAKSAGAVALAARTYAAGETTGEQSWITMTPVAATE